MKNENEIREIIEYYASQRNAAEQENIVSMLREIQEVEGYIPVDAQEMAAEKLGVKRVIFSCIMTQNCMKQCRTSPNMKIDGKLYTGLTEEKVLGLIRTLK